MTAPRSVSIVINTLNRAALLKNTLDSFLHLDKGNIEVVVVNGPSTDDTDALLARWGDAKIKIGRCPERNLSMSRNIGIAMAAGDIVAFIDDDALPEPEWIDDILAAFDSDEVAGAGGKVFDNSGYRFQFQFANSNRLGVGKWQLTSPSPHYCFPGAFEFPYLQGTNAAFRRSRLLEIGGFDEAFEYYLDETDVCLRLIDRGYIIRQLDNAYVHHKFAPSHLRTRSAVTYRYPVLKSKIYFSHRYAPPYLSQTEIDADNEMFFSAHRKDVIESVQSNRLAESDRVAFEEHVIKARTVGAAAALQTPRLISSELLAAHESPFKLFPIKEVSAPRLTIVLLCEDYPPALLGGIARITHDKATALARLGHKVHVIARGADDKTVDFEDGVWVHRINWDARALTHEAAALKIPQSHWSLPQSFLVELDRIATHRPIDIVETPIWNTVGIAVLLSGRYTMALSLQTTLKLSLGSRPDLTESRRTMRDLVEPLIGLEQYSLQHSHGVIANSRGIIEEVEAAYAVSIDPDCLHLCHHGMPDWRANGTPPAETTRGTIDILFVGRLEKRKGIDLLLEAAPSIVARHPDVRFHIVGDDTIVMEGGSTYRARFEQAHAELAGTRVVFHGKVDDAALRRHYADCDFFVAPSRLESFGLIYLEAMMFGKAVIGSQAGGIPEVVSEGVTGLLIPPGDARRLEEAIVTLIADSGLRVRLGENGRRAYEQNFSDDRMAAESIAIYRAIIARTAARAAMTHVAAPAAAL